ncbi:hypothetical protein GCM10010218_00640 [Streptomyces mashuensis]|uniref:DUF4192 domain-containing protein n=1 Tax=Streptomyces mashuensis TaxID=33904 RepID=A0A919ASC7_9ACTN|nr:DUF4192 domain-containing protein [Streptomyces mashuensis]GHF24064.1 hypothetical protein GCM10010218_00640 [Streptomyces mashuensis]
MTQPDESLSPSASSASSASSSEPDAQLVSLRTAAELADALPYLMGFQPTDSIVLLALHGARGRFGGRLRLGIPANTDEWADVSDQLAETLVTSCTRHGTRPDGIVLYLCQEPRAGETAVQAVERLRPLAQSLRVACGRLEVPVYEALCLSDGRFWSYCCPDERCCPAEGTPLALPGTTVMAAAATYAGIQVRGSLRDMEARYAPFTGARAVEQETAFHEAAADLIPRILIRGESETVRRETLALIGLVRDRFQETPAAPARKEADARDDALVSPDEAAMIVLGLQDRVTRDQAAEWMEGPSAPVMLRVWRALARRCVTPYGEHAAAPLTLAGWVAWSLGDHPEARVAFGQALHADPDYLFAQLLHRACNEGMDPELLRRCLRQERDARETRQAREAARTATPAPAAPDASPVTAPAPAPRAAAPEAPAADGPPAGVPEQLALPDPAADPAPAPAPTADVPPQGALASTAPGGPRRPSGPAGANGPAGKAATRRRVGQRGARGRR